MYGLGHNQSHRPVIHSSVLTSPSMNSSGRCHVTVMFNIVEILSILTLLRQRKQLKFELTSKL